MRKTEAAVNTVHVWRPVLLTIWIGQRLLLPLELHISIDPPRIGTKELKLKRQLLTHHRRQESCTHSSLASKDKAPIYMVLPQLCLLPPNLLTCGLAVVELALGETCAVGQDDHDPCRMVPWSITLHCHSLMHRIDS